MARLKTIDRSQATGKAKELLDKVHLQFGVTPNLMRDLAHSPAVLGAYVNFYTALVDGLLDKKLHDQIAMVVAEANGCEYCLSAHAALGRKAGLSDQQLAAARDLNTGNDRVDAALKFAREIVVGRGHITPAQFEAVRQAGFSDGEIVEIIGHAAVNIFTNYFNNINQTEVDFLKVAAVRNRAAA
jgi:uncharacterized peroxidase-related enzyme